jgi:hypothetical protein
MAAKVGLSQWRAAACLEQRRDAGPLHAKFQRTRGVLRLMAAVIHSLWEKGDRNPLILPSTIPIDDARV